MVYIEPPKTGESSSKVIFHKMDTQSDEITQDTDPALNLGKKVRWPFLESIRYREIIAEQKRLKKNKSASES